MPKTYVATSRHSIEDIATIAAFLESGRIRVTNRSIPVVQGVAMIANIIRDNNPSFNFNLIEATEFLSGIGLEIIKGNRGARELAKQLQHTELQGYMMEEEEYFQPQPSVRPKEDECILSTEDKAMLEERRKKDLDEQMKNFKNITGLEVEE